MSSSSSRSTTGRSSTLLGLDLRCSTSSSPRAVSSWTVCSTNNTSTTKQHRHHGHGYGHDRPYRAGIGSSSATTTSSTNPFDDAASIDRQSWGKIVGYNKDGEEIHPDENAGTRTRENKNYCHVVAYGTDQGSIHCRVYPTSNIINNADGSNVTTEVEGKNSTRTILDKSKIAGNATTSSIKPYDDTLSINGTTSLSADFNNAFQGSVVSMTRLAINGININGGEDDEGLLLFETNPIFVVLVDDHKGAGPQSSTTTSGAYASFLVTLNRGSFQKLTTGIQMPRMSCCAYDVNSGFVYAAGTSVLSLPDSLSAYIANALSSSSFSSGSNAGGSNTSSSSYHIVRPTQRFSATNVLPSPVRTNPLSLALMCHGSIAVIGVNHSFYVIRAGSANSKVCTKIISLTQSSQVHPAVVLPIISKHNQALLFVGSARECTTCVIDVSSSLSSSSSSATASTTTVGRGTTTSSNSTGIRLYPGSRANQLLFRDEHETSTSSLDDWRQTYYTTDSSSSLSSGSHFLGGHNNADITTLTSPILSAAPIISTGSNQTTYYVAVLTSDGLVQLRHPSCLAVPFRTIEVGSRPNNFYYLQTLHHGLPFFQEEKRNVTTRSSTMAGSLLSVAYSGDARIIIIKNDTKQDQADLLMKLSIDAFGSNGFPRAELADVLRTSYSATSYVGAGEPSPKAKQLLLQYLEAMLNFNKHDQEQNLGDQEHESHKHLILISMLCLAASGLSPPAASLANRAAKAANERILRDQHSSDSVLLPPSSSIQNLVSSIADSLLAAAAAASTSSTRQDISLLPNSTMTNMSIRSKQLQPTKEENATELIEASMWLLRSAGLHRKALRVLRDKMEKTTTTKATTGVGVGGSGTGWTLIHYESYAASHLSELWASNNIDNGQLVLNVSTTKQLLESNPELGLNIFISYHPISKKEWSAIDNSDDGTANVREHDPIYHCIDVRQVIRYLKSMNLTASNIEESVHMEEEGLEIEYRSTLMVAGSGSNASSTGIDHKALPLMSGRDLAIKFIESVIGISTGRSPYPTIGPAGELPLDPEIQERIVSIHEELAYLLLEGIILERKGNSDKSTSTSPNDIDETHRGKKYRSKLRRLLVWPRFQGRANKLLEALPPTFLFENAILYGMLGHHEDALRILYNDIGSLDLALRYCDNRYEQEQRQRSVVATAAFHKNKRNNKETTNTSTTTTSEENCVYLPLVRVALEKTSSKKKSSLSAHGSNYQEDTDVSATSTSRDIGAAIQILTLRSHVIDRVAALQLLPSTIPVAALARPFLIPALAESESQRRRYKLAASVLRARYVGLKRALTDAEIASQASWRSVPSLRALKLEPNDLVRISKPTILRPASQQPVVAPYFPNVTLIKHYFRGHLLLQVKISNDLPDFRTLGDVAFIVAETSSEGAVIPVVNVPLKVLPARKMGCAWCALTVVPTRLEGAVLLTCELRYTIMAVDLATGAPLSFSGEGGGGGGRTYVEELNDIEIRPKEFRF